LTTEDTEFTEEERGDFGDAGVPCGTQAGIFWEIEKKSML
jgi:hypothetical protein